MDTRKDNMEVGWDIVKIIIIYRNMWSYPDNKYEKELGCG